MADQSMSPESAEARRSSCNRITAMRLRPTCALSLPLLLAGCSAVEHVDAAAVANVDTPRAGPTSARSAVYAVRDVARLEGEIRLVDTRVIRELGRPQPYQDALSPTHAQNIALIVGGSIVGATF